MDTSCANCCAEADPAFTLAAYPVGVGDAVLLDFCSSDCLQAWTVAEEGGPAQDSGPGHSVAREEHASEPARGVPR